MKQQKTDRRSQRTYRLVSSALAELLREKPYDEILVQDILDRAGIGRTKPRQDLLALPHFR